MTTCVIRPVNSQKVPGWFPTNMPTHVYRSVGILIGLAALLCLHVSIVAQQSKALPKAHRHFGVDKSDTGEQIPEFSMVETTLEANTKKENVVTSRNRTYEAFTVDRTRLFIAERSTGKVFEIRGLPLEWRPFSDLTWANDHTLMFDRWSQPHYGLHYSVDMKAKRLTAAVPFPDKRPVR